MKWPLWFYSYLRRGRVYFWNRTPAAVWTNVANMIILDETDELDFCFAVNEYVIMYWALLSFL